MSLPVIEALGALPSPLRALIVGRTAGIGLGVARQLSSSLPTAHITISGRNTAVASQICSEATHRNLHFKRLDASLMSAVKVFCEELSRDPSPKQHQLNLLVMSQGILSASYSPTVEGIDMTLALNYYSRMYLIRQLIATNTLAPNAIIISVHNGKVGDPSGSTILWDDMDLSRTSSSMTAIFNIGKILKHNFSMNDIMLSDLATGSKRTIIHSYPGFVRTDIMQNSNFPGFIKWIVSARGENPNAVSPEVEGERMLVGSVRCWDKTAETGQVMFYMDEMGEEIKKVESSEDVRRRVREHTWERVEKAVATGETHEAKR